MLPFNFAECASALLCGSFCASAPCYRLSENVGVVAVVVAELKLRNVQRQILGADLVEAADDAAAEPTEPEARDETDAVASEDADGSETSSDAADDTAADESGDSDDAGSDQGSDAESKES